MNGGWGISYEIALGWMPPDHTDKSKLVQVMAGCRQATSHYLSQCWPRSLSPYGVTRPQWVDISGPKQNGWHLQMTSLNIFYGKKIFVFVLQFLWSLVQMTISQHWCRWWLGTKQTTSNYLNQWWLRCIMLYSITSHKDLIGHVNLAKLFELLNG